MCFNTTGPVQGCLFEHKSIFSKYVVLTSVTALAMAPKCCPKCYSNEIDCDGASGESVCTNCGHVLEECAIVSEVQFAEGAGGQSSVVGQFVPENGLAYHSGPGFGGYNKDSREVTLANGKRVIQHLSGLLRLNTNHGEVAHRFFQQVGPTIFRSILTKYANFETHITDFLVTASSP